MLRRCTWIILGVKIVHFQQVLEGSVRIDWESVQLTVHKESVVVEEIKEVELRCRRAPFIYDRNYNRIGYSNAVMHLEDFRWKS